MPSSPPTNPNPNPNPNPTPLHTLTTSFLTSFIANTPPTQILNTYFTRTASLTEHGPRWARSRLPFLATTFQGRRRSSSSSSSSQPAKTNTLDDYYDLLAQTLRFIPQEDTLPAEGEYVVDEGKGEGKGEGRVVVAGLRGRFESVRTGRGWEERFVYVLGVREVDGQREREGKVEGKGDGEEKGEQDGEGKREGIGRWRIETLELWADPLSAWMACGDGGEG